MANLGRLSGPERGVDQPLALGARSDAELVVALRSRVAALLCAAVGVAVGAASFVIPARDSGSLLVLLALMTAGAVGAPFAVVGITRVRTEQRMRERRRREEARIRLERESALRRKLSAEPRPRSVAEARRDPDEH